MRPRSFLAIVALAGCSFDPSYAPSVSLTCAWAPVKHFDVNAPAPDVCHRVEALDADARVTLAGPSCATEDDRCAVAATDERVIVWVNQATRTRGQIMHGYVPCSSTCEDEWPAENERAVTR